MCLYFALFFNLKKIHTFFEQFWESVSNVSPHSRAVAVTFKGAFVATFKILPGCLIQVMLCFMRDGPSLHM